MKLLAAACGWLRRKLLGSMPAFNHWLPEDNSREQWQVGPDRCFYCLTHTSEPSWQYVCPRRRPPRDEIET